MARLTDKDRVRARAIDKKLEYIGFLFESLKNEAEAVACVEWAKDADIDLSQLGYSAEGVHRLCVQMRAELQRLSRLI